MGKLIWSIFWILVGDFLFFAINLIPAVAQWSNNFGSFLPLSVFALLLILGVALLLSTLTGRVTGLFRKYLILTASAGVAIPIGFVALEPVPALISDIIFYIIMMAFLAGAVGTIVLAVKRKSTVTTTP